MGENGSSFGDRPDIAGEPEICQICQEFLTEHIPAAQILNIIGRKMEILNVGDDLLQARCNSETTAVGTTPEKQVEVSDAVFVARLEITLAHGQLVEITEHGQIQLIAGFHKMHLAIDIFVLIIK